MRPVLIRIAAAFLGLVCCALQVRGAGGGNSKVQFEVWCSAAQIWAGTATENNSRYTEGDTIPVRFAASLEAGSVHTLLLSYDFSVDGVHYFIDSLGSFNTTVQGLNPAAGINGATGPVQLTIPVDATLPNGAQIPGVISGWNIVSWSVSPSGYSFANGVKGLQLTFKVAGTSGRKDVVLAYGIHMARENEWGHLNGASVFPGASTKAFASLDGASHENVSVNPTAISRRSDVAITKSAIPSAVESGETAVFRIHVTNLGPDQATGVVVTDVLPVGVSLSSVGIPSQGSALQGPPLSWSVGVLGAGQSASFEYIVLTTDQAAPVAANTATVSSTTIDPNPGNNQATASLAVSATDKVPPTIQCPQAIVVEASIAVGGEQVCGAEVWFNVTAQDDRGEVTLVCVPASGSRFPVGTTTVECVARDEAGNESTCSFQVTVRDTQAPNLTPPPWPIEVSAAAGSCGTVVVFTGASASDNCDGQLPVVFDPASGSVFPVGTTMVKAIAVDSSLNRTEATFSVIVRDNERPVIAQAANVLVPIGDGQCDATVNFVSPTATDNCPGNVLVTCEPPSGSVFPAGETTVVCRAVDAAGNESLSSFKVIVFNPNNSWVAAKNLVLSNPANNPSVLFSEAYQCIGVSGESRWFKFKIEPGSKVIVTLSGLPANYDLVLFKDIKQAFNTLSSPSDLVRLNTEFAPEAFSPEAFSPEAFSPEAFSPEAFSPEAFSPEAFSPEAFSPEAFSPEAFSPEAFSPEAFSPEAFSPEAFSPEAFSPEAFSPEAFSPEAFSPEAFSGAQSASVIAISAFPGVASEGVMVNTWNNTGEFYVRVRGRNGAFSPAGSFHLSVFMTPGACAGVNPVAELTSTVATGGGFETIILVDNQRLQGVDQDKLIEFAGQERVNGVIVDVSVDKRVQAANAQADAKPGCPYAKNLVAEAIKEIIRRFRAVNPIKYVVIVGNDDVIPFYRHPDQALLASERNYVPPVRDTSSSQAALRLGYVLGQDYYGTDCDISLKITTLPIPDLAVGRLVEKPAQIEAMLAAYALTALTANGVAPSGSALVTGYDFLADAAEQVAATLAAGLGSPTAVNSLISSNHLAPAESWTAAQLRQKLLHSGRHDLIFLAGHFSASRALAADYVTRMLSTELASAPLDHFLNTLIFSAGCHSGYNIVDPHAISGVTEELDWAQAFAAAGANLIAGTGYQYGDTELLDYSERLYLSFTKQLLVGSGPVSIGQALNAAKRVYLAETPQMRGIHEKVLLQTTLFGFPMLQINLLHGRVPTAIEPSIASPSTVDVDPGFELGLATADVTVDSDLEEHVEELRDVSGNNFPVIAIWYSGSSGAISSPAEPILPVEARNVTVQNLVLRGAGFLGGTYTDLPEVLPLTGAPATEIRGVHAPFLSDVFFPVKPWAVNYFDAVCAAENGLTRLMTLPTQFRSTQPGSRTGWLRKFDNMRFRLYYSANIQTYNSNNTVPSTPALSAAPDIAYIDDEIVANNSVHFRVIVTGNPAAGIQEAWITYTIDDGGEGEWISFPLTRLSGESSAWDGVLAFPTGVDLGNVRYMVQAANGVGLVSLANNFGHYFIPGQSQAPEAAPTAIAFDPLPAPSGPYNTAIEVRAKLTDQSGGPIANQRVTFTLGSQSRSAYTGPEGYAATKLQLIILPGQYDLRASFNGTRTLYPSTASQTFTIVKKATALQLTPANVMTASLADPGMVAVLKDADGRPLGEKTVFFILSGSGQGPFAFPMITDFAGRARLQDLNIPQGVYTVHAQFSGAVGLPGETLNLDDPRYNASTAQGNLTLDTQGPDLNCVAITQGTDAGEASAVVNYTVSVSDNGGELITPTYNPPSGSIFPVGDTTVVVTAVDAVGNSSTCSFTVKVTDNEQPVIAPFENLVVSTAQGSCVAVVTYFPTATDNVGVVSMTCVPASGSLFGLGTHTVSCTATDDAGNSSSKSFTITVLDTTAPVLTCVDIVRGTDPGLQTAVVNYGNVTSAIDNCSAVTLSFNPPSGATFSMGTHSVTVTATDGANNTSTCTFNVVVRDSEPPVVTSITASPNVLGTPNHKMVRVKLSISATDNIGLVSCKVIAVSSSEPINGTGDGDKAPDWQIVSDLEVDLRSERAQNGTGRTYTITLECKDAAGNIKLATATVFVPK